MTGSSDDDVNAKSELEASKTYPQQAGTIRKNAFIAIKHRPCKVVDLSTSKTGKHGHAKCHFIGIDIFIGKKLEDIVPSSHNCDVSVVICTEYQLLDISEDRFMSLYRVGAQRHDLRLPNDKQLLTQIKEGSKDEKHIFVTAMSTMGEAQICVV